MKFVTVISLSFFAIAKTGLAASTKFAGQMEQASSQVEVLALTPQSGESETVESMFDKISRLYNESSLPTLSTNIGGHVGRCYLKGNPNVATNAAMLIRSNVSDGPLGDDKYQLASFWNRNASADYFDQYTAKDLEAYARTVSSGFYDTTAVQDQSYVTQLSVNDWSHLRDHGDYLVELIRNSPQATIHGVACYYYIKGR